MDRYQNLFSRLAEKNQGAFVPFVTVGDPNPEQSLKIMETLVESGADALELGIPFSDPLADGPTIQGANIRALASDTTPTICFELIGKIRAKYPDLQLDYLCTPTWFIQKVSKTSTNNVQKQESTLF